MSNWSQRFKIFSLVLLPVLVILSIFQTSDLYGQDEKLVDEKPASISIPVDMGDAVVREAARVKHELHEQARSLFVRTPLGWDWDTIDYIYRWIITLPLKIPEFMRHVIEQSRLLGIVGSIIILAFIVAVFYSLIGQKRVLTRVGQVLQPLKDQMPEGFYPYFLSILKVVVSALIPLLLLAAFSLINAFMAYKAPWFLLIGRLLKLWAVGQLLINLLRESLVRDLFPISAEYGKTIFRISRLVLVYALGCMAVLWGAEAFNIPRDVLALLKFAISLSIVFVFLLLLVRKNALLSLIPNLPYAAYQTFLKGLHRYYFPVISLTFLTGLLWCFGYKRFCRVLWTKTWAVAGAFVAIMLVYHFLQRWLQKWSEKKEVRHEQAQFLFRSFKGLLLYATITATILVALQLLGLMDPLERVMSFPVLTIGNTPLSLWILLKAALILIAFIYVTRLLQAYLDYKVYPALGIEPGLGYALNTFLKYFGFVLGFLVSLSVVGIDLRILLVFAGAIGIGVGLGMQSMASNLISGFSIVFGRKIRKDDWIQVGNTRGVVTDIYLRATKVRTRDNVEYLIPNADFISTIIVNYTLSSPMIRVHIPVGVSYNAEPDTVRNILLKTAEMHPDAAQHKKPEVRFIEYGDSSIIFELLIWMDVRETEEGELRSRLYFTIFEELKKAGIEIPFPQRDLHIRSGISSLEALTRTSRKKTHE